MNTVAARVLCTHDNMHESVVHLCIESSGHGAIALSSLAGCTVTSRNHVDLFSLPNTFIISSLLSAAVSYAILRYWTRIVVIYLIYLYLPIISQQQISKPAR